MEILQLGFVGCLVWFGLSIFPASKFTRKGIWVDGGDRFIDWSMTFYPTFILMTIVCHSLLLFLASDGHW